MRRLSGLLFAVLALSSAQVFASVFSDMVVLGDSLSDNGNLFVSTGGAIPEPQFYYEGRFQDGEAYSEQLYEQLGLPGSLTPAVLGGDNYAVGGARSRYHNVDLDPVTGLPPPLGSTPTPWSLLGQLDTYQTTVGGIADPDALYVVWSGANDIGDALRIGDSFGPAAALSLINQAVADMATVITSLIGMGGEHFLIPNVPDLALTPRIAELEAVAPGAGALATQATRLLNAGIDAVVASLLGVEVVRFDTFALFDSVVADMSTFGLSNVSDACLQNFFVEPPITGDETVCAAPDEFLFWDEIHPTAAAHEIIAGAMAASLVPVPDTLALVMLGLAGLHIRRRALRQDLSAVT